MLMNSVPAPVPVPVPDFSGNVWSQYRDRVRDRDRERIKP